ncbi:translation initiation factor [Lithospermum erythrorhizon]|uniref:Translation initiation factor n=1 Tax=Lithospermum erythrorhizon TaxID=34254 RepID=A0AAV3R9P7_LITER
MFKKTVKVKLQKRLSGADKKKLKRTIRARFSHASDDEIDILLPPKVEMTVSKYPNRILLYCIEGECPILFDVDGRGIEIFPTVYSLWKVPNLLSAFLLKGGEVSRFVIGGADLMFPGILIPPEGYPSFSAGEPWAVKVPGNPAPIAVGSTNMSSEDALKAGLRGKALLICHHYRDMLWESVDHPYVPNAGFYEDVVFEDPTVLPCGQASDSAEVSVEKENGTKNAEMGEMIYNKDAPNVDYSKFMNETSDVTEKTASVIGDLKLAEKSSVDEVNVEDQPLSAENVDALLDKCLLQALHSTVKEKDLPMPGSILWSRHILPSRPSGITLDIRKSSFKKLSKWLQAKSSAGLISFKEHKHKEATLSFINRTHPEFTSFKPEKREAEKMVPSMENVVGGGQVDTVLEVAEIYKPSVHIKPIFNALGADCSRFYSASEASEIVFQYIEKEKLVKPTDRAVVVLDSPLCDALFKGTIKKGPAYPTEIHKKDARLTFISRMQAHHRVTRGVVSVVQKGSPKPIQIMTERRQGNKKMTKLSGLESFLIDAETLASELQKKFACSMTMTELPGKKGLEVLVQGGVMDVIAKHLLQEYGVPKRYIEVYDKTKK